MKCRKKKSVEIVEILHYTVSVWNLRCPRSGFTWAKQRARKIRLKQAQRKENLGNEVVKIGLRHFGRFKILPNFWLKMRWLRRNPNSFMFFWLNDPVWYKISVKYQFFQCDMKYFGGFKCDQHHSIVWGLVIVHRQIFYWIFTEKFTKLYEITFTLLFA